MRETAAFPGNVTEGHPTAHLLRQPASRSGWARRDAGRAGHRGGSERQAAPASPAQLTFAAPAAGAGPRSAPASTKRTARRGRAHKGAAPRPRPSAAAETGRHLRLAHNGPVEGPGVSRRPFPPLPGTRRPGRGEDGPAAPRSLRPGCPPSRAAARGPAASRKLDARSALRPRRGLPSTLLGGGRAGALPRAAGSTPSQGPGGTRAPAGRAALASPRPLGLP